MKSHSEIVKSKLKDEDFASEFYAQKEFLDLSYKLLEARLQAKISQKDLAKLAGVTQQQISKIEKGIKCNSITLFKVIRALNCKIVLGKSNDVEGQFIPQL